LDLDPWRLDRSVERLAVDLLQRLGQVGIDRVGVLPVEVEHLLRQRAALLLVEVADRQEHRAMIS
jgi:hypothetical protein